MKTIIWAEDNPLPVSALQNAVAERWTLRKARSVDEALYYLDNEDEVSLVIIDLILPFAADPTQPHCEEPQYAGIEAEFKGAWLARHVHDRLPAVPIMFVTIVLADSERLPIIRHLEEAGLTGFRYYSKPDIENVETFIEDTSVALKEGNGC